MAAAGGAGGLDPRYKRQVIELEESWSSIWAPNPSKRSAETQQAPSSRNPSPHERSLVIKEQAENLLKEISPYLEHDTLAVKPLQERLISLMNRMTPFEASGRRSAFRVVSQYLPASELTNLCQAKVVDKCVVSGAVKSYSEDFLQLRHSVMAMAAAGGAGGLDPRYKRQVRELEESWSSIWAPNPSKRSAETQQAPSSRNPSPHERSLVIKQQAENLLKEISPYLEHDTLAVKPLQERLISLMNRIFEASGRSLAFRVVSQYLTIPELTNLCQVSKGVRRCVVSGVVKGYSENFLQLRHSVLASLNRVIKSSESSEILREVAKTMSDFIDQKFPEWRTYPSPLMFAKAAARIIKLFDKKPLLESLLLPRDFIGDIPPGGEWLRLEDKIRIQAQNTALKELKASISIEIPNNPALATTLNNILHSGTGIRDLLFSNGFSRQLALELLYENPTLISDLATPECFSILSDLVMSSSNNDALQRSAYYCLLTEGLDSIEHLPLIDQVRSLNSIGSDRLRLMMQLQILLGNHGDIEPEELERIARRFIQSCIEIGIEDEIRDLLIQRGTALIHSTEFDEIPWDRTAYQKECKTQITHLETIDKTYPDFEIITSRLICLLRRVTTDVHDFVGRSFDRVQPEWIIPRISKKFLPFQQCRIIRSIGRQAAARFPDYRFNFFTYLASQKCRRESEDLSGSIEALLISRFWKEESTPSAIYKLSEKKQLLENDLRLLTQFVSILKAQGCVDGLRLILNITERFIERGDLEDLSRFLIGDDPFSRWGHFLTKEPGEKLLEVAKDEIPHALSVLEKLKKEIGPCLDRIFKEAPYLARICEGTLRLLL